MMDGSMRSPALVVNIHHGGRYDVYCGRPGKGQDGYFGNPIRRQQRCTECGSIHDESMATLECYRRYFMGRLASDAEFSSRVADLKGKILGCFCRPKGGFEGRVMCHAQILAAHANGCEPADIS